ncbi:lycopene cyclase domain-containing protein [Humibacter sp. RRB41]|uniref:lycopene cyclase domain-containing protein n=1 Tax=Humibacter sp. RRB41 TaxID=2919946 RepID=UPI001FAA94FA|nr:lycopene cyclase domain-containing protein [Humibacter sp. RRB41]
MTYLTLCIAFLAVSLLIAAWALTRAGRLRSTADHIAAPGERRAERARLLRRWLPVAAVGFLSVAVLTAVFDSLLIVTDIIRYDSTLISGIRIGLAPIEDFSYPLAAAMLVPSLWSLLTPTASRVDRANTFPEQQQTGAGR